MTAPDTPESVTEVAQDCAALFAQGDYELFGDAAAMLTRYAAHLAAPQDAVAVRALVAAEDGRQEASRARAKANRLWAEAQAEDTEDAESLWEAYKLAEATERAAMRHLEGCWAALRAALAAPAAQTSTEERRDAD